MKERKIFNSLIKFGLSDLKLVGIGAEIIKIGLEMPILDQFVVHVKNSLISAQIRNFYLLEMTTFTTFKKLDCGMGSRSNLGVKDPKP